MLAYLSVSTIDTGLLRYRQTKLQESFSFGLQFRCKGSDARKIS